MLHVNETMNNIFIRDIQLNIRTIFQTTYANHFNCVLLVIFTFYIKKNTFTNNITFTVPCKKKKLSLLSRNSITFIFKKKKENSTILIHYKRILSKFTSIYIFPTLNNLNVKNTYESFIQILPLSIYFNFPQQYPRWTFLPKSKE